MYACQQDVDGVRVWDWEVFTIVPEIFCVVQPF